MKHIVAICTSMLLAGSAAFAQTEPAKAEDHSFKSVRGHEVLPQKGEWALGVSATGFLGYMGNLMNNTAGNTAPAFNTANTANAFAIGNLGGWGISGKYMKTATMAYRVRVLANFGSNTYSNFVAKNTLTPDPLNPQFVEDKLTINYSTVMVGAGFEKRRGSGRVQGIYGAELLAGVNGSTRDFTYGNGFSATFLAPVSTSDFAFGTSGANAVRKRFSSTGTSFLFGARAFAGVEYFIAPKISLGGEIGYTLGFSTSGKGYETTEQWNGGTAAVSTVTTPTHSNRVGVRSMGLGFDNTNAAINLHFYF
ncbi:MAG: hypothetical protein JNM41_04535 [Flavipsychrobacter sp.]|nr:hypothetical protein [Flavipsychrobacter sp.]